MILGDDSILGLDNAYQISKNVSYGNSYDICESCRSKLGKARYIADRELQGKLHGKRVYHFGDTLVCEDCVREAYEELFADEAAFDTISDEELEAAQDD